MKGPKEGDHGEAELRNTALLLSYDGRPFHGWQRLRDQETVQGTLEEAIAEVFDVPSVVAGSGRTDRGAHAVGQVASTRLPLGLPSEEVVRQLNEYLQETVDGAIIVENAANVPEDFHALHSCTGKTYRYAIWLNDELPPEYERRVWHVHGDLDLGAMAEAVPLFEGEHDFASFASKSNFDRQGTVRWLSQSSMFSEGPVIEMVFTGNGFLYKMVRNLVRAVVRVGEGRSSVDELASILKAKDRRKAPGSAPASGLYLDEVYYAPPVFPDEASRR
ncbi:tRNA pseudouridine synthase A [Planctomycetes bacterium Poly30]|uniref:tRNA pseudouridine synthase A n=1 Tax=Saltatorellus ferox TaxID=2528018 RepID=A0A518EZH7_9BACT|nr:tRNA pseudouridine synthase A [Planctomycetes bacterium Poly30]